MNSRSDRVRCSLIWKMNWTFLKIKDRILLKKLLELQTLIFITRVWIVEVWDLNQEMQTLIRVVLGLAIIIIIIIWIKYNLKVNSNNSNHHNSNPYNNNNLNNYNHNKYYYIKILIWIIINLNFQILNNLKKVLVEVIYCRIHNYLRNSNNFNNN